MRKSNLAAKDLRAHKRLVAAAESLAVRFELLIPDNLLSPRGEPLVKAMKQRECIADLLEALDDQTAEMEKQYRKLENRLRYANRKAKKVAAEDAVEDAKEIAEAVSKALAEAEEKPEVEDGSSE